MATATRHDNEVSKYTHQRTDNIEASLIIIFLVCFCPFACRSTCLYHPWFMYVYTLAQAGHNSQTHCITMHVLILHVVDNKGYPVTCTGEISRSLCTYLATEIQSTPDSCTHPQGETRHGSNAYLPCKMIKCTHVHTYQRTKMFAYHIAIAYRVFYIGGRGNPPSNHKKECYPLLHSQRVSQFGPTEGISPPPPPPFIKILEKSMA